MLTLMNFQKQANYRERKTEEEDKMKRSERDKKCYQIKKEENKHALDLKKKQKEGEMVIKEGNSMIDKGNNRKMKGKHMEDEGKKIKKKGQKKVREVR